MSTAASVATHVAVDGDRISAVGSLADMQALPGYSLDDRYEDKILLPGFVEGHSHVLEGHLWRYVYVGFYDRVGPDGKLWQGVTSIDGVVDRLRQHAAQEADGPVIGWGFDPIFFDGRRMNAGDLDRVSTERPVVVLHASGHCLNTNQNVLTDAGVSSTTNVSGIIMGPDGNPTGELRELAAMFIAFEQADSHIFDECGTGDDLWRFASVARSAGVTTATDLYSPLHDDVVASLESATADPAYPLRLVPAKVATVSQPLEDVVTLRELCAKNNDKLLFGPVKIMTDGSIQGFTARLKSPGYYNGAPNGIWNAAPAEIESAIHQYHQSGIQAHIHANGDEATEFVIDAIAKAAAVHDWQDHRHVLQHCQLITPDMLRRCAELGICTNLFANHIYYWGDQHRAITIGPERAKMLDPVGSAHRAGVHYAIHSDAPITPLAPLFTAWCAVNRRTASGQLLGADEQIQVADALYAITMGAAFTLKLEDSIGSIDVGKLADFSVLDDDPFEQATMALRDIGVHETVLGGVPTSALSA